MCVLITYRLHRPLPMVAAQLRPILFTLFQSGPVAMSLSPPLPHGRGSATVFHVALLCYHRHFHVEESGELLQDRDLPADSQREVMRRSRFAPAFDKRREIRPEAAARVRVARGGDRPGNRFALRYHQLEPAPLAQSQSGDRHRSVFDLEFHRDAASELAVIEAEAAQGRFLVGDGDVRWPIMPDEDKVLAEIGRVQLAERAARADAVHHQHRGDSSSDRPRRRPECRAR